jgi:hypothetical protein
LRHPQMLPLPLRLVPELEQRRGPVARPEKR